jgi:hypothetical protein
VKRLRHNTRGNLGIANSIDIRTELRPARRAPTAMGPMPTVVAPRHGGQGLGVFPDALSASEDVYGGGDARVLG